MRGPPGTWPQMYVMTLLGCSCRVIALSASARQDGSSSSRAGRTRGRSVDGPAGGGTRASPVVLPWGRAYTPLWVSRGGGVPRRPAQGRCTLKGMKTAPRFTWIKVGGNWAIRGQGPLDKGDVVYVFNRTRGSKTLVKIRSVIGGAEGQVIAFIEKPGWSGGHPRP